MKITLETPITNLYLVGERHADYLKRAFGISTFEDLVYHFPFRYDDVSEVKTVSELKEGETVTLSGQILEIKNVFTRNGKQIQKAKFSDNTQVIDITWFNQPYLTKTLAPGTFVNLAGKVKRFGRSLSLSAPAFEVLKHGFMQNSSSTHTGRLVPVYPETATISSKWLRSRISPLLKILPHIVTDWMPATILTQAKLLPLDQALQQIHFPSSIKEIESARRRLAFDELFLLQLQTVQRKHQWQRTQLRHRFTLNTKALKPFLDSLPFELTYDQKQALEDIMHDLTQTVPMNRLLEGDVGSGKTVVAAAAMFLAKLNGVKAVLMAPTEVLANQHLETLTKLLTPHGFTIGFFTGSRKTKGELKDFDVYLGTHALLFQEISREDVGLVVIDEQHRFGVKQRSQLIGSKTLPHVLTMTATPIPRTAALTLYGDLSLSLITQLPKGRKKIKTWVVPQHKRQAGFEWIRERVKTEKTQAYFIYPLIDPSDKGTMREVKAANEQYQVLKKLFPDVRLGLLHGRMKPVEKRKVMEDFSNCSIDILISTSVIEVGIDVPNATIMVIEDAYRFGLAQLHQLRGRVGRGEKQSYCLIFGGSDNDNRRLKALENTHSGLELAELDLKLRGPGQMYGTAQSGYLDLKIASLEDKVTLAATHKWARTIFPDISKYPLLQKKLDSCTIQNIQPN